MKNMLKFAARLTCYTLVLAFGLVVTAKHCRATEKDSVKVDSLKIDTAKKTINVSAIGVKPKKVEKSNDGGGFLLGLMGDVLIGSLFDRDATDRYDYYHHDVHRGNVSDAMKKASDDNTGNRDVGGTADNRHRHEHHGEQGEAYIGTGIEEADASAGGSESSCVDIFGGKSKWLSFSYGQGSVTTGDLYGISDFSLALEALSDLEEPMNRIDFVAGVSHAPVQETSELRHSLDGGITLLHIGMRYNFYTTPRYTFMGNYLFAGAHLEYMMWDYKHTIRADDYDSHGNLMGTSDISTDGLAGIDLQVGTGWNVAQTKGFAAGLEFTPGVILWAPETDHKFKNDVFDTFVYFRLSYMMHVRLTE